LNEVPRLLRDDKGQSEKSVVLLQVFHRTAEEQHSSSHHSLPAFGKERCTYAGNAQALPHPETAVSWAEAVFLWQICRTALPEALSAAVRALMADSLFRPAATRVSPPIVLVPNCAAAGRKRTPRF